MAAPQASSRLEMLQARFQQRQLLEKEQKLLQLYDQQQLRAHQVAQRGSAGSNGSNSSGNGTSSTVSHHQTVTRTTTSTHSNSNPQAGGKVRQMFDERRQTTVKGIDKSYPLEPLDNRSRKQQNTTTTSNVVVSSTSPMKNGNPMSNRQSLVMRRTVRSEANSNVNGGKPIVSYHEEVSRESCGPTERNNDQEEFGDDNNEDSRYANGNRHVDQHNEMHIEDVTNDNFTQRHRTTAKIHLSEFDSNEANRIGDNLENERFPEDLMIDAPDRLPKRAPAPKKPSQAEARLERFKNSNTKRSGPVTKQMAGNTTSYTKKRMETNVHSGSTSRASIVTRTEEEEETSTRARSPSPEIKATGSPRSSTPEERARKLTHPVVDRSSIVTKTSGVSKVSQLTHKNSMDFYPRRKSEFEKSKTFRKLQMELGESSPEPAEPEEELPTTHTKPCKKRSSILDDNIYNPGSRSSSSSPITDRDNFKEIRSRRDKSPEHLQPFRRSQSPICETKSLETKEEISTSSVQSHTYSSRRHSSSLSQTSDHHSFEERRASREMSPEHQPSRKGSESPIYERESKTKREETKTSDEGHHSTNVESDFYSSRRRSSSSRPTIDDHRSKGRRVSRGKSPERPLSRKGSESPIYEKESATKRVEMKTTAGEHHSKNVETDFYTTKRRSSSSRPTIDNHFAKGRSASREKSPERPQSRKGSKSPIYGKKSTVTSVEIKTTSGGIKTTGQESNIYCSRRRSSSSSPIAVHEPQKGRRNSREMSPEHPRSRKRSESPIYKRRSITKREETQSSDGGCQSMRVETSNFYSSKRQTSSRPNKDTDPSKRLGRRVSPEKSVDRPQSRKGSMSPISGRKSTVMNVEIKTTSTGSKTTEQKSDVYSSRRRSSSPNPTAPQERQEGRRYSREMSPEHSQSRRGSVSPFHEKNSIVTNVEINTKSTGSKTMGQESNIYCSRRRSSSSSPTAVHDSQMGRRNSREMSPEHPRSRKRSESPIYERRSTIKREETQSSDGGRQSMRVENSNFYSSKRQTSSSRPNKDTDPSKRPGRRVSPEKSLDRSQSRKGSKSPIPGRKSTVMNIDIKTTSTGSKITERKSDVYSSRRRSSSLSPTAPHDRQEGRRYSREMSPEHSQSRKGSVSPSYEKKSIVTNVEINTTNTGSKTMGQESNVYSSRRRSSSSSPTASYDRRERRRSSHDMSPECPKSRNGSESPIYGQKSTITSKQIRTTRAGSKDTSTERKVSNEEPIIRSQSPICVRLTRKRSESPCRDFRRPSVDREEVKVNTDNRRTSGGILRSVELVKKLTRPGNIDKKTTTSTRQSLERKTTLEDVELLRQDSRQRSKSPPHRIVKKEKVVMQISREDKSRVKNTDRQNSNEPRGKTVRSRSRTTSPSPPPPSSMKETASFRAKKAERKNSSEIKRIESKHHQHDEKKANEIYTTNLSHEKTRNCDLTHVIRSYSPVDDDNDRSRRSSAETTVKRHETFKVSKPTQRIIKIDRETSVDDDDDLPVRKTIKADVKDKSQLLERIEKIRTTLSKSGRSEQNSQDAKDFERTDSVESALRRFDSIGVETEHHVTVGVDEIDRSLASPSPEPVQRSTKEISSQEQKVTKKSVDSRNGPTKITVAVVKAQPREIDRKPCEPSKDKISKMNLKQKISETTKSVNAKKEKSTTTITPRQSPKPRVNQKITTSLVRKSKLRGEESSGRGEGKISDRSPECKRRLFDDSESEVETDNNRSTVIMSTYTTVTKSPGLVEIETRNNCDNRKIGNEDMIRSESSLRDMRTEQEQPTKVLRSIEDIRKSIKRESQDFNRELKKFNTAMRKDEEMSLSVSPEETVTSGIVSCVKITKTLKPGDVKPVVKIERSTVKLPITHRVAKSPSPDIGVKRSTEGRARTPTASVRRSVPSSPAKSPDTTARYASAELKGAGSRPLVRTSPSPSAAREDRMRTEILQTAEYSDCTDGPADHSELTITETVTSTTTKRNDAFVVELDDDDVSRSKEGTLSNQGKPPPRKQSTEKSLTSQKTQRSPTATPLPRPASALSTSSTGSARGQSSHMNSKNRMATKTKTPATNAPKGPPGAARGSTAPVANDGLAPCKICGRRFNSDRISLHEQICSKTATKKRKQFDATIHRVKGTELEQFVVKKGNGKKGATDRKTSKPEVKSNWRRKHEDFINAIRSAKQVQAHLAAGGKLSDLPPPPASDTSDYVQCPHCGRKFNQGAAERHIPKCQNMMHNKPNPRAPPKPKR